MAMESDISAVMLAEQTAWLYANTALNPCISRHIQQVLACDTLWVYTTQKPLPTAYLTPAEQLVYTQWANKKRQHSWLLGRTLLKYLALQHPTVVSAGCVNALNTPAVWQFPHSYVSLSHTATTAYLLVNTAVVPQPLFYVGLDVEPLVRKPLSNKALRYLLSPVENHAYQKRVAQAPHIRWDLQYWTMKEALYKATPLPYQQCLALSHWQIQSLNRAGVCIQQHCFTARTATVTSGADVFSIALVQHASTK